ncbi:MAG TPA: protein-glutamate O-methyltransferase CheR [Solirubrobacteraceae bacterium]|nr:protein-glutamate O-methyltransferase CheR [Solirubrobacteraceae bacterium]
MSAITAEDYQRFCEGVRQLSGVDLTQYKRPQMERRLRAFTERRGFKHLTDSLPGLRENRAELDALLDRMTINVSQLWRNPQHWVALQKEILPELASKGGIQAWSAGCSYGAEAYTLAAICLAAVPRTNVRILGTDIDKRMVERAKAGEFTDEDARSAPPADMKRWFERVDERWRARPELRAITRFEVGDLLRIKPPTAHFDLIMCRNTVIYFAEPIRDELHARLASALRPGGYLMVGATERVSEPAALHLRPAHPFIFRKS